MTKETILEQQVVMDEDLVPSAQRLRIRRSNFGLLSDIQLKESTLQLVYDVLRRCPFYKAFLVTADVPEIYMQEMLHICPRMPGQAFTELPFEDEILDFIQFLGHSATIRTLNSIRFKMDNKKHIVNLESFREMLHICPRLPHQPLVEPPFEEEILAFLCFLDTVE
nr:hypothetical protein [Tanacetum cinerariifolium]